MNYKEAFHVAIDGAEVRPVGCLQSMIFDGFCMTLLRGKPLDTAYDFIDTHQYADWEIVSFTNKFPVNSFVSDVATGQFYRIKEVAYDYKRGQVAYSVWVTIETTTVKLESQLRGVEEA